MRCGVVCGVVRTWGSCAQWTSQAVTQRKLETDGSTNTAPKAPLSLRDSFLAHLLVLQLCCEWFLTNLHVPQQNINPYVIAHRFYTLEVVRIAGESGQIPELGFDVTVTRRKSCDTSSV